MVHSKSTYVFASSFRLNEEHFKCLFCVLKNGVRLESSFVSVSGVFP